MNNPFLETNLSRQQSGTRAPDAAANDNPFLESNLPSADGLHAVTALQFDPDRYASAKRLSEQSGIPAEVLARNPDHARRLEMQQRFAGVRERNPHLADWLEADPTRAALASDDLPALNRLAAALRGVPLGPAGLASNATSLALPAIRGFERAQLAETFQSATAGKAASLFHTAADFVDQTIQAGPRRLFGLIADVAEREGDAQVAQILRDALADPLGAAGAAEDAAGVQREAAADAAARAEAIGGRPTLDAGLEAAVEQAFAYYGNMGVQSLPAMLLALATRNPAAGGGVMGGVTGASTYADLRGDGVDRGRAAVAALGAGGTEAALGRLGLSAATRPGLATAGRGIAVEALTEGQTEAAQINIEDWARQNRTPLGDQLLQIMDATILGSGFGAIERGGSMAFDAVTGNWERQAKAMAEEGRRLVRSVEGAGRIAAITEAATQSKLGGRSPADAAALAEAVAPGQVVYLNANEARVLFQDDPGLLSELVGGQESALEAEAVGDFVIPMDRWVSVVGRLPNAQDIARHARMEADALSAAELEAAEELAAQQAGDTSEAAERATPPDTSARDAIVQDITGQLVATGRYAPDRAEAQAKLWGAAFERFGRLTGQDPKALYDRYMAGITDGRNAQSPLRTRRWEADGRLDALIESVRNGAPDKAAAFGPTLTSWLVSRGGVIDFGGELRGMDAGRQRPGLVNAQGMDLDRAREAAAELGYLPADSDVSDFLDLIQRDLMHGDVYAETAVDPKRAQFELEREELERAIDEHPVLRSMSREEFAALTNQQIVDMLSGRDVLNFDQPASDFESRFGDSKVVDGEGRPLLVYHGTSRDFTEFRMGSAPGWGRGIYFTDNRDQAEADYAGGAGGRVVEAYLSIRNPWRGGFPGYEEVEGTQAWKSYTGSFEDSLDAWNEDGGFAGEVLRELGYDGVIAENSNDIRGLEIVAFDTSQIIPAAERDAQQQFDESAFRPAVVSWAKGTFGDTIAPNGRPAWQNFVAWFGDSQVVDGEGRPLEVYHGTASDITEFKPGSWFAEDVKLAHGFIGGGRRSQSKARAGSNIVPAYLSIKNPLDLTDRSVQSYMSRRDLLGRAGLTPEQVDEAIARLNTAEQARVRAGLERAEMDPAAIDQSISRMVERQGDGTGTSVLWHLLDDPDLIAELKRAGIDGIKISESITVNPRWMEGARLNRKLNEDVTSTTWLAFESTQIKSATGNRGTFDPADASILNQSAVDYRGDHRAPVRSSGAPAHDLTADGFYPDDVYSRNGPRYYGTGSEHDAQAFRIVAALRGKPDEMVSIFRAVPLDAGDDFNVGDWVAITRGYAVDHGESVYGDGGYKVISKLVRAADIYTNGDSIQEWGYDPESEPKSLFQRAADAIRRVFGQQPTKKGPRGQISIFPDRRMSIALFEKADASTFIHESAHFFLEVFRDLAADPNADPKLVADFNALLEWMGVESADQIEVEHHEKFARGFEMYVGEGKAPSPELQSVFAQFKAWILGVYRTLRNLNVELTDDVRGVFDRMLASEEEIDLAQAKQGMSPLVADASEASRIGLTEAQFKTYTDMLAAATEEAKAELNAKLNKAHKRAYERWYKEERAKVRAEVEAAYNEQPAVRAKRILQGAKTLNGEPVVAPLLGLKLDREAVVAGWGEAYLGRIGRTYAREGGVDPDIAASMLGFTSGDALLKELANLPDTTARIDAETDAIMRERHGDPMVDGTLDEAAMEAAHNSKRVKVLEFELETLAKLAGQPAPTQRVMKAAAQRVIAGKTSRTLRPNDYLAAERRAARDATAAAARGEYGPALEAKRRQAFNAVMYREALAAKAEFDKHRRYLRKVEGRRDKLGKAGADYLAQVDAILEALELRQVSGRAVERRQRLADWAAKQEAEGNPVNIPQKLLDEAGLVNIADMPLGDLRDVVDTVKQIEHLAKLKNKLLLAGELRDRAEVDAEMANSVAENHDAKPERTGDKTWRDTAAQRVADLDVQRLLPSNIARELDGYKEGGPVWRHVIKPIRDAVYGKLIPAQKAMQEAVAAIYQKHYSKEEIGRLDSLVYRPEVGDYWSKGRILTLAMNWGSDGNREAILTQARSRITEEQALSLLRTLDARDWAFVQDMVDQVNSYWPEIAEVQRRRTGLVPKKVEGAPFTIETADGKVINVRGGYFPLKYDSERSHYGATKEAIEDVYNEIRVGKAAKAATRNGHTIERVGSGGKVVALELDIATNHMRDVLRDIHLGDAVNYVHNVLNGTEFANEVKRRGKAEHLTALNFWLKDVAAGEMGARDGLEAAIRFARQNTTAAVLAWKATTAGLQVTGLIQTATVIGRRKTLRGIMRLYGKSWVGPNSIWQDIRKKSAFMDERFGRIPDAVQVVADARDGKIKSGHAAMIRYGYIPMARMQMIADAATWLAGEAYGLELFNGDVEKARAYADDLVVRGQAPDNFIDKPAVARGTWGEKHRQSELVKATTMLLSYMITKGNVAREKYQQTDFTNPMQAIKFGVDMIQLFWLEQAIMSLFTNGLPSDDDEDGTIWDDWGWWVLTESWLGALATIPLLSQLATEGRGYTAQGIMERTYSTVDYAWGQWFNDELNEKDIKALINLAGVATGIPSSQINTTLDALWRARDGEDVAVIEYLVRPEKPRDE